MNILRKQLLKCKALPVSYLQQICERFLSINASPKKIAISLSVGIYIAFSPFIGLHTLMVLAASWCFRLPIAVIFAASCSINNPWTALPIYSLDYGFGYWIIYHLCGCSRMPNPSWYTYCANYLYAKLGIPSFCVWSFLIGGNILGIIIATVAYPVFYSIFVRAKKVLRILHKESTA